MLQNSDGTPSLKKHLLVIVVFTILGFTGGIVYVTKKIDAQVVDLLKSTLTAVSLTYVGGKVADNIGTKGA